MRREPLLLLLAAALLLTAAPEAPATHFRYGHINWKPLAGNTVVFTVQNSWRRDDSPSFNPCINPATNSVTACSGVDGLPEPGDVIRETIGDTLFFPGDGSPGIGSPGGNGLLYLVTSVDRDNNWLFGSALDRTSLPAIDTLIEHTYAAPGNYLARIDDCCRISAQVAPNAHINNPDLDYRVETLVRVGTGNGSPVTSLPPIVACPQNALCTFVVPAADPDGDPLTFRLSSAPEADGGGFRQPGPTRAPNAASIDPNTGVYTWDTTGATLGPAGFHTLYSTQVTIEERDGGGLVKGKVAVDFFITLIPDVNDPPAFDEPTCGGTQMLTAGATFMLAVTASDPDAGDLVTLNAAGLPGGATMAPLLPTVGNPVSSTLSWTPTLAQVGSYLVNFTATDGDGQQALCPVTLDVVSLCGDGTLDPGEACDDGNLDAGDCCSPVCLFEPDGSVCGGGIPCSGPDTCQAGVCTPGAGAGDGDEDGTVDCLDNCEFDANADQSDIDGDGLGDVCDPEDVGATVTKLKFKGNLGDTTDAGLVKVKGHFISLFGVDALSAESGIAVRVRDQFENDASHFWPFSECQVSSRGRVRCVSPDRTTKGVFKPIPPTPTAVIYSFKLKRLPSEAPFKEPIEVTISYGPGIDRHGVISDCVNKGKLIVCKEP